MTKPNKSAWSARQSGLRSAGRISKKSDRLINLYEKSGLDKSLQFVRDYHASSKRESTKEEILHSIIDLANHVFDSGSATLQMIDEMRDTYLELSGGRRYIKIVDGEKLDKFEIIMRQMIDNIAEGQEMTAMKITEQQLRRIIKEELLSEQLKPITAPDDLLDALMNGEYAYQAMQYEGIKTLKGFKEYVSDEINAAIAGGVSMKDINRVVSLAWKTEKQARKPVKHSWSAWD